MRLPTLLLATFTPLILAIPYPQTTQPSDAQGLISIVIDKLFDVLDEVTSLGGSDDDIAEVTWIIDALGGDTEGGGDQGGNGDGRGGWNGSQGDATLDGGNRVEW